MAQTTKIDNVLRKQLSVIILVTLVGVVSGYLLLSLVHDSAGTLNVDTFSSLMFFIPCILMFIGSFIVAATATEIGRQLYVASLAICLVTGVVSMFLSSAWMGDPTVASQLLANSPEGTVIVAPLRSAIIIFRDIAAFVVIPTIGNIFGAWIGSRLHPMTAAPSSKSKKKGSRNVTKKSR